VGADDEKRLAAEAAAELVVDTMTVGLGTGTTVAFLLDALARRAPHARYVASSPRTAAAARATGLDVHDFADIERLDLTIDGADQVAPDGWLVKGGGGAHTREKIVAAAAERFVVIVDSSKVVDALHAPVPLELSTFGLAATLRRLGACELRDAAPTPDGGRLADYCGSIGEPSELARWLSQVPGVVAHGLFSPDMVDEVLVATGSAVQRTIIGGVHEP
jgi:ribose 5-phosphate isomerase A